MKRLLLVHASLLLLVLLTGQVYLHASEPQKKWTAQELTEECDIPEGFLEGGKAWGFKDYTKKPGTFEKLKQRFIPSTAQKEVDAWYTDKPKPKRSCGFNDFLKRVKDLYYGKQLDSIERFFNELKHPTEGSLSYIKEAILRDEELRYATDQETGLPPAGIIITSYPKATTEEKEYYKKIFKHLLQVDTLCTYNVENSQPLIINEEDVKDLKPIFIRYNIYEDYDWEDDILHRMRTQPSSRTRLQRVREELAKANGFDANAWDKLPADPKKEEKESMLRPVFWLLGAAAVYGVAQYFLKDTSYQAHRREHGVEYGRLFMGGVK